MQSRSAQRPSRPEGFTLVELMVVVAIATILFAIAVPSYITYVRQSRRTEARTAVLDLAG
ncbi:MAG: prepilin-type N-terminal cleavage/methylation domain-containing protein, partial [Gammaproteobacteria bacterium]